MKIKKRLLRGEIPKARQIQLGILIGGFIALIVLIIFKKLPYVFLAFFSGILITLFIFYAKKKLAEASKLSKIEEVFPDFLQMVSSNLRAGMTVEKSMLLSARKEFDPLDKEVIQLGKDIVTGKELTKSLEEMGERINSEKIRKTISLLVSGIKSGGNLSLLLKQTADNMREKAFLEKKTTSNILMYIIFIFFAVAIGAPVLFALSTIMVEMMSDIFSGMPEFDAMSVANLPFNITTINISNQFLVWFSVVFILMIDIMASFVLGIVSKGKEQQGFKFMIPLISISLTIFFSIRFFLSGFFKNLF